MKTSRILTPLLGSIALLLAPAHGAEIAKMQNNTPALNAGGAWSGGVVPGVGDVMLWNSLYTVPGGTASLSQLGGDLSVLGLKVTNVGGAVGAAATMVGFQNGASANTLTIGAGGIDLSAATQALHIQSKVLLGASQTWAIANANTATSPQGFNNGEDLGFAAQALATFNFGGNTVTTSGAGQITITSGYTLSNGTLNVGNNLVVIQGGASRLTTLDSTLTLGVNAGGLLRLQSNSGALLSNAPINLNGGTLNLFANNVTNAVTLNGSINVLTDSAITITSTNTGPTIHNGNITGSGALSITNSVAAPARFLQLGGNNSGYSGTVTLGGTAGQLTRLTNANAGSAAATWSVSSGHTLQVAGVSVSLGTLNGAGTVTNSHASNPATLTVGAGNFSGVISNGTPAVALTKSGAGTLTLSGLNTYTGATTVSGGTLLVSTGSLNGTAVSVANTATYAVQGAFSGTVNTNVAVADGGTFSARPLAAGVSLNVPSLTVGTTTGGTINISTAALGNPTVAPLDATAFSLSAGTQLKVTGSALVPQLGIPLISYTGSIGGAGFGGLTLQLPARTVGNLVNNVGSLRVDMDITSIEQVKWRGNVNALWDLDPTGADVTGTQNWRTTVTNIAARYLQGTGGTDSVTFDDTAVGNTNVNLTTTLTPGGVTVNNSALAYTFSGAGKISGGASLTKTGNGTLTLANTVAYDHSGGTTISAGTLQVGDGATAGAGILPTGAITNDGTISLNRPDNFTVAATITGTGALAKNNTNTVNFSGAPTLGNVAINAGTLRYDAGGTVNGVLSGSATLGVQAGTLQIAGSLPNTFNGTTNVTGGVLQLNNSGGNAIGGTINFTGTGGLQLFQPNQIEDTATINYNKAINGGNIVIANDTFAALNVINGNDTGAQVQAQNGFVVTGLVTVQNTGLFGVASNNTGSVGGISLSGTPIIRIAANSNPSTLNVGASGIVASGGTIQVGQGVGAFDAVLNLDGDVTTTGNVAFTDGNFLGVNLRQITLASTRTFNIGAGTTTTIAPDIAGAGGLTKTGNGTLQLTTASASTYTGDTLVSQGRLLTTPAQVAGAVIVLGGATFQIDLATAGTSLLSTNLDTATGSTLQLGTGALGNPFAPVIATGALTINGTTTLRVTGSALTTATGIPLISYASLTGFPSLSLSLPGRIAGTLVNNTIDSRVDLDISGIEQVKWRGNVAGGNWDIDPDGTAATGTPNWLTTITAASTRYFQGVIGIDTANFDDSATGTTTVNLTTTLTPNGVNVDNSAKDYTFTGPGKISGPTALTKLGTRTLTIANTAINDYTGGTNIGVGSILKLGNGVTNGAGAVTGAITNDGTLVLNRPDDLGIANTLSGSGILQKDQPNTAIFTVATTLFTPVVLNAGTLAFNAGGTLGGDISGAGKLEASGGTLQINGGTPNTYTGTTTVSAGILQLAKSTGVDAVGGNIVITGTGQLALLAGEQIPDTATLTFTGSSADSVTTQAGLETYGNVIVNSSVGGTLGGQVIMRSGFTVLGTATLTRGILGVASSNTATLNAVVINAAPGSDAILRIAGNGGPSTLNIGAGGITASGGEIQVKFNVNNQDAVVNLGGDFTATGNVAITNAGYTGANLNIINLTGGPRAFHIAAGTTTTVAPDFGDGDLTKDGDGTLTLNGTLGAGAFTLTANDGNTNITTTQTVASLTIADGATVTFGTAAPAPAPEFVENAGVSFGEGGAQAVPEPASASLLILGALGLLARRSRKS